MAQVLGESGRYVSQEAVKNRRKIWVTVYLVGGTSFLAAGFLFGTLLPRKFPPLTTLSLALIALGSSHLLWKWGDRKLALLERDRMKMLKGVAGERQVAMKLDDLPDEYKVIHDLTTPFGNLDHIVVGPTGVFVLDAKNWKGVVANDGKGELLFNGKPTDKPYVRQFLGRVMGMREKVMTLNPGLDRYFKAVFVFTSARVEAKWGTTREVHCIHDDQIFDYITDEKFGSKLAKPEIDGIAQAFLALAHMDSDFTDKSVPKAKQGMPARS